jgi:hypothetical protein
MNINTYYNINPYYYHLSNINWKIFGTLTFRNKNKRKRFRSSRVHRDSDFKRLLELSFYWHGMAFDEIPYFLRHEHSETSQYHLHFLVANSGRLEQIDTVDLCNSMTACWNRDFRTASGSNGTSVIIPYEKSKKGAKYFCKEAPGSDSGYYDDFVLSDALIEVIHRSQLADPGVIQGENERHRQDIQGSNFGDSEDFRE